MGLSGNIMSTWAPGWKFFKNQLPQDTVSISIFSLYALNRFCKIQYHLFKSFVLWKPFLRAHFSVFSLSFSRSRKNKIDASYAELLEQSWHQETPNLGQKRVKISKCEQGWGVSKSSVQHHKNVASSIFHSATLATSFFRPCLLLFHYAKFWLWTQAAL